MQNPIKERITLLMQNKGMSLNAFSFTIGVAQSTLDSMFKKDTEPSFKTISAILNAFPLLSAEWLLRGEGSMFKGENVTTANGSGNNIVNGNGNTNINQSQGQQDRMQFSTKFIAALFRGCRDKEEEDALMKELGDTIEISNKHDREILDKN